MSDFEYSAGVEAYVRQGEKSDFHKVVKFVENLTELGKLQSTLLNHLQKTLKDFQIR